MNNPQYATLSQALTLVEQLDARGIGGGVKQIIYKSTDATEVDDQTSGVYDSLWDFGVGPGVSQPDHQEGSKAYCLRFVNGAEGCNVGLILDRLKRYPTAPEYVYRSLAEEVNRMAEGL